jgi:hypothetical protein
MTDLANNLHFVRGISPQAARTDNTAIVSEVCDTKGYGSCVFAIMNGANTDANATFTVLVEDSEASGSGYVAVADEYLTGTEALASFDFADDNECRKIGYTGIKRYVRVTINPAGNDSGNIFVAGVWVLGHAERAPTANPPQ